MSFGLDLSAFRDKTMRKADMVVRKIVIDVGTALVMKSPVGDPDYWIQAPPPGYVGGRFRANWQYGVGNFDTTITNDIDQGGGKTISAIVGKVKGDAGGKIHYLTNSLPYGPRLEDGFSRQAPHGMVHLTVLEFQPIVDAAARALS